MIRNGVKHPLYGDVLVIAPLEIAAPVLEGYISKAVAPCVHLGKGTVPECFWRWITRRFPFLPRFHVYLVNALPVARIGKGQHQFRGIVLRLGNPFRQFLIPRFRFHHGQFRVPVFQHIVGLERFGLPARTFNASRGDNILPPDAAPRNHIPPRFRKGRIDIFGSGFGFVHDRSYNAPLNA